MLHAHGNINPTNVNSGCHENTSQHAEVKNYNEQKRIQNSFLARDVSTLLQRGAQPRRALSLSKKDVQDLEA
jgi:hypothetical protein